MTLAGELGRKRRGLHHLIVYQRVQDIPGVSIPVLYLAHGDQSKEELTSVRSMSEYLIAHSAQSKPWMLQRARALGLFYDFLRQQPKITQQAGKDEFVDRHRVAISRFQNCLKHGTIVDPNNQPVDNTGLWWRQQSSDETTLALLRGLAHYLQWLQKTDLCFDLTVQDSGSGADAFSMARFLLGIRHFKEEDFFSHLKEHRKRRHKVSREVVGKATRGIEPSDAVRFPIKHFSKLFSLGFKPLGSNGKFAGGEDITAKLAVMLCAFGGLRSSEPLHIWVDDVTRANGSPLVVMHHPVASIVHSRTQPAMTRKLYLERIYGMQPRNLVSGKFKSGWKGIACDSDHMTPLFWLPLDGAAEYFWTVFEMYIHEVRPALMRKRRRLGLGDHPFLLVSAGSANRDDETSVGAPYTLKAFRSAWERAISRLRYHTGDQQLVVSKPLGTTLHGLRHLYGGLLAETGMSESIIQKCLHHISPNSQRVYTNPPAASVNQELNKIGSVLAKTGVSFQVGQLSV